MSRQLQSSDALQGMFYRYLLKNDSDQLSRDQLRAQTMFSPYYNSLIDDLDHDAELRKLLIEAYYTDKTQFWKIVITYRSALHAGMSPKTGNFWERLLHPVGSLFRKKRTT